MSLPDFVDELVQGNSVVFEQGLKHLSSFVDNQKEVDATLLADLCNRISASTALGAVERDRRTVAILRYIPPTRAVLDAIAESSVRWAPEVRNAIARTLPPNLKQAVFARPVQPLPAELPVALPPPASVQLSGRDLSDQGTPAVLLLGTYQEQEANRNLLEREPEPYRTIRASSLDEFQRLLTGDICGVVIASSWWKALDAAEHATFLKELLAFSSLFWVKIDISGYAHARTLAQDIRTARYRDEQIFNISHGNSSAINEFDLVALRQAADRLCNPSQVRLCPADIGPLQSQVLVAGVIEHVQSRHFSGGFRLEEIGTSTLPGGRSGALIVRVQPDDGGLPLVAKLSSTEWLRDEMGRFQHFILPWDALLRPRFHFHGDKGAIIFGLVDASDSPLNAAPTLEDTLRRVLRTESGAPSEGLPTEKDLEALITMTVDKIMRLNAQPCLDGTYRSFAWIDVDPLNTMLNKNITWNLPCIVGGLDPLAFRHDAVKRVQTLPLSNAATVHGDIHLGNVLVRDYRVPFLIDYAYAGPGHPCYDLVRFESSMLFQMFRVTSDEATIRTLLKNIIGTDTSLDKIKVQFPSLCSSIGNRLAIHSMIKCRAACLDLLKKYSGSEEDYLAMKLVISYQSLTMQNLQASLVRATVVIVAELLAELQLKPHSASSPSWQPSAGTQPSSA